MAISFVSEDSNGSEATSTTITVTAPTGIQDGDLLVGSAVCSASGGMVAWTGPTGFTDIFTHVNTLGRDRSMRIVYKIASSESGNYTFTNTNSTANKSAAVQVYRGVNQSTPIDVTWVTGSHHTDGENDFTPVNDPITTVTDDAFVLLFHHASHRIGTAAAPTNYTLRSTEDILNAGLAVADREIASAALETPTAWLHTGGDTGAEYCVSTIAIRPAVVGGLAVPVAYHHQARHWRKG